MGSSLQPQFGEKLYVFFNFIRAMLQTCETERLNRHSAYVTPCYDVDDIFLLLSGNFVLWNHGRIVIPQLDTSYRECSRPFSLWMVVLLVVYAMAGRDSVCAGKLTLTLI